MRGLLLHRREAPQRPPAGGLGRETEAGIGALDPRSRGSRGFRGPRALLSLPVGLAAPGAKRDCVERPWSSGLAGAL